MCLEDHFVKVKYELENLSCFGQILHFCKLKYCRFISKQKMRGKHIPSSS